MFTFAFTLAAASTAIELMLAAKIPSWRKNAHKYKLVNLVLSVLLSFVIGIMFGAAGLIAMTAAIISTILSIPGYSILHWMYDSPQAQARGGNQYIYYKNRWKQALVDLGNMIFKIIRIITFPIWMARSLAIKYKNIKTKLARP